MLEATAIQRYSTYDISQLIGIAERHFNKFIRERDKSKGCISCPGGQVENAGHYLSAGHNAIFRFNEHNANGQCIHCNKHLHANLIRYRINLVKKIGVEKVEWLEGNAKKPFKWDRFTLIDIIIKYKNLNK